MAGQRKKILVVEDELIVALDINRDLQKMGYKVLPVVSSGEEAVKKAALLKPALILMDIVLKGKTNGITAAEKIISEHNIPVIFLTAYADTATIKKAIKTNAFGYLVKPFNTRELQAAIEMALHRKKTDTALKKNEKNLLSTELLETNRILQNEIKERKKIEAELISSQNRLEYVKQIGALANSTLKLDKVLELILKGTLEASNASAGMIFLHNPENRSLSLGTSIGLSKGFVREYRKHHIQPGEGLTGHIARSGDPIYIRENSSSDPRIARSVFAKEGLNSFIGVPIYAENEIVGVMNILSKPPQILSEQEITLATAVGAYVGSAIRNAQHFEERMRIEIKLIEYQKHLQSLTSQISLIEENEKRRIAAGLHDCISQPLALSKIKLGQLNKTTLPDESRVIISELLGLIEQTISETRTLTFELSPPILYELGLSQAIKWLIDEFRDKHNLHTVFEDDESSEPFDNNIRFFLFQAVRELLINIVKHSHADKAKITMSCKKDKLRITVEDNGRGFSGRKSGRNGFGLFNIRERMHHINGHFEIKAVPRRGTRVTLIAPFTANKNKELTSK